MQETRPGREIIAEHLPQPSRTGGFCRLVAARGCPFVMVANCTAERLQRFDGLPLLPRLLDARSKPSRCESRDDHKKPKHSQAELKPHTLSRSLLRRSVAHRTHAQDHHEGWARYSTYVTHEARFRDRATSSGWSSRRRRKRVRTLSGTNKVPPPPFRRHIATSARRTLKSRGRIHTTSGRIVASANAMQHAEGKVVPASPIDAYSRGTTRHSRLRQPTRTGPGFPPVAVPRRSVPRLASGQFQGSLEADTDLFQQRGR